jgi:hypothetical protein
VISARLASSRPSTASRLAAVASATRHGGSYRNGMAHR